MSKEKEKKANETLSKFEAFLKAEDIEFYFCSGMIGGFHFFLSQGPVDRLLLRAFEQMQEQDPKNAEELMMKLLSAIQEQCESEIEGQEAVIH